jgi:hypothetical protein
MIFPSKELSVETRGRVAPVGHNVKYPTVVLGTTVMFTE